MYMYACVYILACAQQQIGLIIDADVLHSRHIHLSSVHAHDLQENVVVDMHHKKTGRPLYIKHTHKQADTHKVSLKPSSP